MKWPNLFQRKIKLFHPIPWNTPESGWIEVNSTHGIFTGVNRNQQWVFFKNKCPHAGGRFEEKCSNSNELVCILHRYRYNLTTGKGAHGQGDYIQLYVPKEEEDGIYLLPLN